jgi:hypothetical protein
VDLSLTIYICIVVLSGFNLLFGIYWWVCERGASAIYKVILILWAGLFYSHSIAIWGRTNALTNNFDFLDSWIWHTRSIILLGCILVYSIIMTVRFCRPKNKCSCKEG